MPSSSFHGLLSQGEQITINKRGARPATAAARASLDGGGLWQILGELGLRERQVVALLELQALLPQAQAETLELVGHREEGSWRRWAL